MSVPGLLLLDDSMGWNGLKIAGVVIVVVGIAGFFAARYLRSRMLVEEVWRAWH
jgi:hypothetical protein